MKYVKKWMTCLIAAGCMWTVLTAPLASAETAPTGEAMIADAVLARPVAAVATILGAVGYVLTLPFSLAGGNADQVEERLVAEPASNLFGRCLGCKPVTPLDEFFEDNDN